MKKNIFIIVLLLFFNVTLLELHASNEPSLQLSAKELEIKYSNEDKVITRKVTLRNDSAFPVRIKEIVVSCSCTVATISSDILEPGSEADVNLTIDIGGKKGSVNVLITIYPDSSNIKPVNITAKLFDNARLLTLASENRMLRWESGAKNIAKTALLRARLGKDGVGAIIKLSLSNPEFTGSIQPSSTQNEYIVSVAPKNTAIKGTCLVTIIAEATEQKETETLYAVVY